jgi:3' exoribonuclease, RNase T-like
MADKTLFVVDVETDGPSPGADLYSMLSFGAVRVDPTFNSTFYATIRPISDRFDPEALAICGFTREQTLEFEDPALAIPRFYEWIKSQSRGTPVLVSDNPAFDAAFISHYFHRYCSASGNPFGYTARRIGDFAAGLARNWEESSGWKQLRGQELSHNALDDALQNAHALVALAKQHQLKLPGIS